MTFSPWFVIALLACGPAPATTPSVLAHALEAMRHVGPNAQHSRQAADAWQQIARATPADLPTLLAGMDRASDLTRNWIRSALDPVLERARAEKHSLPTEALKSFLLDHRHDPQARRLAFDLLTAGNEQIRQRFLAGMLDDPSPELRHEAVALALTRATRLQKDGKKDDAKAVFRQALKSARERGQLDQAAKGLRELGQPVDMAAHLGMIRDWHLIGPFPDPKEKGLDIVYPPEQTVDLAATYKGKSGSVTWKAYVSKDPYGLVNIKTGLKDEPTSVAYALAEFKSPKEQTVDVRVGAYNAFKLWVNGKLTLDRRDAFTGMSLDHYTGQARLKAGRNIILVKTVREDAPPPVPPLCQFQLRLTDANGQAIRPAQ